MFSLKDAGVYKINKGTVSLGGRAYNLKTLENVTNNWLDDFDFDDLIFLFLGGGCVGKHYCVFFFGIPHVDFRCREPAKYSYAPRSV